MTCKEKFLREEGFRGGGGGEIILQKMGLGNLLGQCLKMLSLTTCSMLEISSPGKVIPPY